MSLQTVDFLPNRLDSSKCITAAKFEPFPVLLAKANEWLKEHSEIRVRSCETVDFRLNQLGNPEIVKANFRTRSEQPSCFVRGLRLWNLPQSTEAPSQLSYFNVVPKFITNTHGKHCETESLDEAIARTNARLARSPILGKVIAIDSLDVKYEEDVNPDVSCWVDASNETQLFLTILRVIYIQAEPESELIGLIDFAPEILRASRSGHNYSIERPLVDSFPIVFARLRECILELPTNHRVIGVQTLHFRQNFMQKVDTSRTSFCEDNIHIYQLKFLRLTFVVRVENATLQKPLILRSKLFVPDMKRSPGCFSRAVFESQQEAREKLVNWVKSTAVDVLSVETLRMRVFSGAENFEGLDTMHTWNRVIHHSTAAHTHHHNFLHGRTHHRHGVQHRECQPMSETYLHMYRLYYTDANPRLDARLACENMSAVEEYMLGNSDSNCVLL